MRLTFTPDQADRLIGLATAFRESGAAQRVIEPDGWTPTWPDARKRDWLTGQEIVTCDPACSYPPCAMYRQRLVSLFGNVDGLSLTCSGCLECTLVEEL